MADLKTNYKDDVLVSGQQRKYNMIQNSDGTVSFVDVSSYAQYGDTLKAEDFNATNAAVNALNGKTESLEEDIAAAEGKIGQIVTIPVSQTIMSTFISQKVGTVRQYTYSVAGVPTDYPQAFKDAGINYCPVMTIGKAVESVGMILIQDAKKFKRRTARHFWIYHNDTDVLEQRIMMTQILAPVMRPLDYPYRYSYKTFRTNCLVPT